MSVNKVILIGNVGLDPDIKEVGNELVANITLATSERAFTDKNGTDVPEKTEWHNIILWKGLARIAKDYIRKGAKLYVEGKLTTRVYESNNSKHYVTEILAKKIEILSSKANSADFEN